MAKQPIPNSACPLDAAYTDRDVVNGGLAKMAQFAPIR
jgi:hypothetical protein